METEDRQRKLEEIFSAALERDSSSRLDFVRTACGGDDTLRRELESLLSYEGQLPGLLETPAIEAMAESIGLQERPLVGRTLGRYSVVSLVGVGGMGEVYAARDIGLGRLVALKVISPDLSADPERKGRFVKEAKAVSALNHPNIVTLHDVGTDNGVEFLVMEYIEGKTLDKVIPPEGLELKQALQYAIEIADAFEHAHNAGIVHRDLKPGNLIVNEQGTLKVLDFGLAKLAPNPQATEPTLSMGETILGTPHYMSPEQAQGKPLDWRSDIFSFGVVLYEMVTGRRAFQGEDRLSTLAAIVNQEPPALTELNPRIPRDLERIVRRCLRKDPQRRFQHMADLRVALQEVYEEAEGGPPVETPPLPSRRFHVARWVTVSALLGIALSSGAMWLWLRPTTTANALRTLTRLTWNGSSGNPTISSDGKLVAYSSVTDGRKDIWVQQADGTNAIQVTHDPAGAYNPAMSRDGTRIVFESAQNGGSIYEVPTLGGKPRFIAQGYCPKYSSDGAEILFLDVLARQLSMVPVTGGAPVTIGRGFAVYGSFDPHGSCYFVPSPNGRTVLARGKRIEGGENDSRGWWLVSIPDGKWQETTPPAGRDPGRATFPEAWVEMGTKSFRQWVIFGRFAGSGHEKHLTQFAGEGRGESRGENRDLFRVAVSGDGKLRSDAEQLTFTPGMSFAPSVSDTGRMVFYNRDQNASVWIVPLDTNRPRVTGKRQQVIRLEGLFGAAPSVSRDGTKIAFWSNRRVAVKDLVTGQVTQLTSELPWSGPKAGPIISPDGSYVAYYDTGRTIDQMDLYSIPTAGGASRRICENCGQPKGISADGTTILTQLQPVSADGTTIVLGLQSGPRARVGLVRIATGEVKEVLRDPSHNLWNPFYSWDDKWVTFLVQLDTHHTQLYITPVENSVPAGRERWVALTSGEYWDDKPQLSPDGNTLYFASNRDGSSCIWAQRLDPATKRPVGKPFVIQRLVEDASQISPEVSVARDKIVTNVNEFRSDIWMMELGPGR
jgi:eukaryotic-like serine/threonine-protein kinase